VARLVHALTFGRPVILKRAATLLKAVPVAVRAAVREYAKGPKKAKRAAKPKAARPARKRASKPKPKD
jgi:hypothetical protein